MYDEFLELYREMKEQILVLASCKKLVLTRVKHGTEEEIKHCIKWLTVIRKSRTYFEAVQRNKELPPERLRRYKMLNMIKDFPEVGYRRRAMKALRDVWVDTMPEIIRRKDAKESADQQTSGSNGECNSGSAGDDQEADSSTSGGTHCDGSDNEHADLEGSVHDRGCQ